MTNEELRTAIADAWERAWEVCGSVGQADVINLEHLQTLLVEQGERAKQGEGYDPAVLASFDHYAAATHNHSCPKCGVLLLQDAEGGRWYCPVCEHYGVTMTDAPPSTTFTNSYSTCCGKEMSRCNSTAGVYLYCAVCRRSLPLPIYVETNAC